MAFYSFAKRPETFLYAVRRIKNMIIPVVPLISGIIGFLSTLLTAKFFIRYLRGIGLVVKDQHKEGLPLVPISGGLLVLFGFLMGTMMFVFFRTFVPSPETSIVLNTETLDLLFASVISIMLVTLVGFIDDLMIGKTKDAAIGLNQWQKPLLTVVAAVPLMVIDAGTTQTIIPFFGKVNLGILYPLLAIPIGFIGAANMVNMLGGLNGLESGLGIIYFGSLGLFSFYHERYIAALLCLMVFLPLLVFFYYNKYPAKIFPGNSLTYLMGGTLAAVAIVGDIEKAALIISAPFFLELILKLRGKLKKPTVGYMKDGKVYSRHDKIYSIPHLFMNGRFTEKQVVYFVIGIEVVFAVLIWVV